MKGKKLIALGLTFVMTAGILAGCGSGNNAGSVSSSSAETGAQAQEEQTAAAFEETAAEVDESRETTANSDKRYPELVAALGSSPTDLMPWGYQGDQKASVLNSVYETLFELSDGDYRPSIGKSYTVVDETHWDVEIWDNIQDSEGNPITADDVVFCFNEIVRTGNTSKWNYYGDIEKVSDYVVRFTWASEPNAVYALEGPFGRVPIYSQAAYEAHDFATDPVGTGPYKVDTFVTGSKIVLTRNENYWALNNEEAYAVLSNAHHANVDKIEYDVITESAQKVNALQTGAIAFADNIPDTEIAAFQDGGKYADQYDVDAVLGDLFTFMAPNMGGDSWATNLDFRKAVFYAIDNDILAEAVGGIPLSAVGTNAYDDYVEDWENRENYNTTYDPEKAAELLAASGYNGEEIVLLTQNNEYYSNLLTLIQGYLTAVGINSKLTILDNSIINSGVASSPDEWDFYLKGQGGPSLIGALNTFSTKSAGGTVIVGVDEELQTLLDTAYVLDTHTDESMDALMSYIIDNAYGFGITATTSYTVRSVDIAEVYYKEKYSVLGGSTYYVDAQ